MNKQDTLIDYVLFFTMSTILGFILAYALIGGI